MPAQKTAAGIPVSVLMTDRADGIRSIAQPRLSRRFRIALRSCDDSIPLLLKF